jgi:hypothetical protein
MKKPILAILALILASLACGQQIAAITPTVAADPTPRPSATLTAPTPTSSPSAEAEQAEVRAAVVRVRDAADGEPLTPEQYIYAGQSVTIVACSGNWCEISEPVAGFVWRGCLSDNPDNLKCQAEE